MDPSTRTLIVQICAMTARLLGVMIFALSSPAWAATVPEVPPARLSACGDLAKLQLASTTITSAVAVTADSPALPGIDAAATPFCRVVAHVRAAPDSDIGVEIWLPFTGWSGVFHGNGNGGFAGVLSGGYASMKSGLERGFATATTDTGTAPATPLDGDALVGHPRKWRDWGRLSTHAMTVTGKAITAAFYGRTPERSYYTGCSTGGQQGLIEALYYPSDYDGILVGAPVVNRTWGHAAVLWDFAAAHRTPESLLSEAKLHLINEAAIAHCSSGGTPGDTFVADPFSCKFDPGVLACASAASDNCLNAAELATARAFYQGPSTRDGRPLFFGWLPGSEVPGRFGWSFLQAPINGQPPFDGLFKWVFGKDWDWHNFDFDRDMPKVDAMLGDAVNDATRGSLQAFKARGGKLIIYHGLADTLVPPGQSVAFYRQHARELGGMDAAGRTMRLFLAPGVMHCGGGPGPDVFNSALGGLPTPPSGDPHDDLFAALIQWTNQGKAPDSVIATKYVNPSAKTIAFQRPLCAYPRHPGKSGQVAGTAKDRLVCVVPPR